MSGSTTCEGCIANPQKRAKIPSQMAKTPANPSFSVIPPRSIEPPRPLGAHGKRLWEEIQREYAIVDTGGVEVLAQLCAALDRAEQLAEAIGRDGALIPSGKDGAGPLKAHPGCREELACRSFVVRSLERLGLNVPVTPARGPGRPPKRYGW